MKCCALSNFVRLSHHYHHFKRERNIYNDPILPSMGCMPYGSANCIMAENITNENEELMYICTKCDKQHNSYKISYIALYFSNYMISILSIHPIHMQFFSLIDIGLHINKRHLGFSIQQMSEFFFKNNPLLSWDGTLKGKRKTNRGEIMKFHANVFTKNEFTNSLFKLYIITFEQTKKKTILGYCH